MLSGADGSAGTSVTYVCFGDWPKTIKADGVTVNESKSVQVGANTYYRGSDGEWYAKQQENAYHTGYSYGDNTAVAQSSANSYKYFKVEPIKWRVVTTDYNGSGKKLLLAENILINGTYYDNTSGRTIDGSTVNPNNYKESRVRAYLNGLSYNKSGGTESSYDGKGFLQTAFTSDLQSSIATTTVYNNLASTGEASNDYVCANTNDKIFLLSAAEATAYSNSTRIRKPTDFAMSTDVYTYQFNSVNSGGYWWLRSPHWGTRYDAQHVYNDGSAIASSVDAAYFGVVPALCLNN